MSNSKNHKWFFSKLNKYVELKNLKQSKQRELIGTLLLTHNKHITTDELIYLAIQSGKKIGAATIYRTLKIFLDAELILKSSFDNNKIIYELNKPNSHHDHLHCSKCDTIVEFENQAIERLQQQIAAEYNFTLIDHRLDLFGICPDCQKNPH